MIFYVGTERLNHVHNFPRVFVSINALMRRKSLFSPNIWIMDSSAFTQLHRFGKHSLSPDEYLKQIDYWSDCGYLEMAVCQDWMCEPFILERTGRTIGQHQWYTYQSFEYLYHRSPVKIMPVLQGWSMQDYVNHLEMYGSALHPGMRVGIGSVCKRNKYPYEIEVLVGTLSDMRPDLKWHCFGVKITSLKSPYLRTHIYSCDSMAWDYAERMKSKQIRGVEGRIVAAKKYSQAVETELQQNVLDIF